LVIPKRHVERVHQLTTDELTEMWTAAQKVSVMLQRKHNCKSTTFTIQVCP
jgi:diadenosine tetraphosphate (Ap4A) HIT family hydrolase